jgi:hypothetical protein
MNHKNSQAKLQKKLALHKETIRILTHAELHAIVGAQTGGCGTNGMACKNASLAPACPPPPPEPSADCLTQQTYVTCFRIICLQ